ncbi:MAG: SDR family oxidoreductase [Alicyclobacillus shizuokensis]|nr:SDR family oxidoreductase [Alicyclobacillus shizuokensis]
MIVLITGAARGLGRALTERCLQQGDTVLACVRAPSAARNLQDLLQTHPDRLYIYSIDVGDDASVANAASLIATQVPKIDCLVNNAGILKGASERIHNLDMRNIRESLETNTMGPIRMVAYLLPLILRSERPMILNISSEAGSISTVGNHSYGYHISKCALNMFSQILANDLKDHGVAVLAVHPGRMRTDMGLPDFPDSPEDVAQDLYEMMQARMDTLPQIRFVDRFGTPMPL